MKPIRDIRRERLAELVAEIGGQSAVAEKLHKDKNQVYQWLQPSESPASRNISDRSARAIELAFGRPRGWMDSDAAGPAMASQPTRLDPEIMEQALQLLRLIAEIRGAPSIPTINARQLILAYEVIASDAREMDDSNVVDFMRKLAERERGNGD